jgi:acetyl-CoA decarbonylase/synthase complex subunit gamma
MVESGLRAILNVFIAYSSGIIITPLFLPYLPGRQFSLKGFIAGLIVAFILFHFSRTGNNIYEKIAWFTIIPVISSFMAMNFTGSSTFTSLSGVKKEMKVAVPLQIIFSVVGIILLIISKLLN